MAVTTVQAPPVAAPLRSKWEASNRHERILSLGEEPTAEEPAAEEEPTPEDSEEEEEEEEDTTPHRRRSVLPAERQSSHRVSISAGLLKNSGLCVKGLIAGWPLLRSCGKKTAEVLAPLAATTRLYPGQTIVQSGCDSASLIFIVCGAVDVFVDDLKVSTLTVGTYIGETLILGVEDQWRVTLRAADGSGSQEEPSRRVQMEECMVGEVRQEAFLKVKRSCEEMAQWFDGLQGLPRARDFDPVLERVHLFHGLSKGTLAEVKEFSTSRVFFPGEQFIQAGSSSNELFILVGGTASVEIEGRLVYRLNAEDAEEPPCLGELGLLGMEPLHGTTVTAQSVCVVRIVHRPVFLRALQERGDVATHQAITEMAQARQQGRRRSILALDWFRESTILKDPRCGQEFLSFLAERLEERVFLADETIIDDTSDERCMYILDQGGAKVFDHGRALRSVNAGAIIGEMNLMGVGSKHLKTVVATEMCIVAVLHPNVLLRGLELFKEERSRVFEAAQKGITVPAKSSIPVSVDGEHRRTLLSGIMKAPFFEGMGIEFVEQLSALSVDRFFMPGEQFIREGDKGNSMFIVVSGEAAVFTNSLRGRNYHKGHDKGHSVNGELLSAPEGPPKHEWKLFHQATHKVRHLNVGNVIGELTMLGISPMRSATVQAETLCWLREICQSKVVQVMADFPAFRRNFVSIIISHLETTVSSRLQGLAPFKDFDQPFRTLLSLSCKRRVYFPGQVIAAKGDRGHGMLIVNVGEAKFEHTPDIAPTMYTVGSHTGCDIMLGIQRHYVGTLTALTVCHILFITRDSYKTALQKYPSPASAEALLEATKREAKALQIEVKRMKLQNFVLKRCTGTRPEMRQGLTHPVFLGWAKLAKEQAQHRRQQHFLRSKEQEWISRHVLVRKNRLLEEHLAELQSRRFDWVASAAWDDSTHPIGQRSRQARLPRIAPIVGPSLRAWDLPLEAPEGSSFATPRMALPPI